MRWVRVTLSDAGKRASHQRSKRARSDATGFQISAPLALGRPGHQVCRLMLEAFEAFLGKAIQVSLPGFMPEHPWHWLGQATGCAPLRGMH
ncbi:hypothetical protein [Rhodoferax fermentans]|uniref:hypothetical protein n=1 Tax=Rhodoferax fermentans TaxID=28066 RepID=UPI0019039A9D|nr:hypothetical protein [Rhodoferax fermentans]MBK1685666.1 hypothetical protein [Rhodoferax fermentans]